MFTGLQQLSETLEDRLLEPNMMGVSHIKYLEQEDVVLSYNTCRLFMRHGHTCSLCLLAS